MAKEETVYEKQWKHAGLDCKVNFYKMGRGYNWRCGYVGLPKGHILYGLSYDDVPADIHGGLTFGSEGKDGLFWFGFDCNHAGDRTEHDEESRGHFWTLSEVVNETDLLAEQLARINLKEVIEYKLRYMPDWFKENIEIKIKHEQPTIERVT